METVTVWHFTMESDGTSDLQQTGGLGAEAVLSPGPHQQ
jgi:hypothetical protein